VRKSKKDEKKGRGAIVAVGLRRIAGAGHSRRRRSANSGEEGVDEKEMRGQEVRPFLQIEKYYSHYRGATKVWPSRSFSSHSERGFARETGRELCFINRFSPHIISCRSLVSSRYCPTIHKNNSNAGLPISRELKARSARIINYRVG